MLDSFDKTPTTSNTSAYLKIHLAVFLFGGAGLFGKLINLSSGGIVLGRAFLGAVFIFLFSVLINNNYSKLTKPTQQFIPKSTKDLLTFGYLGIILAFHWIAFFEAIQSSNVAIGVLTFSTFPIFTTFLEPFFNKETLQLEDVFLAMIALVGVAFVLPNFEFNDRYTQGALWGIASGASFAVLTLLSKRMIKGYTSAAVSFYQNGIAGLVLMPFFLSDILRGTEKDWLYLLLLGLLFTAIAHTLFISSMHSLKAKTASLIASLEPLYAILLAWFFLGEVPTIKMFLGGFVILSVAFYAMSKNK